MTMTEPVIKSLAEDAKNTIRGPTPGGNPRFSQQKNLSPKEGGPVIPR